MKIAPKKLGIFLVGDFTAAYKRFTPRARRGKQGNSMIAVYLIAALLVVFATLNVLEKGRLD